MPLNWSILRHNDLWNKSIKKWFISLSKFQSISYFALYIKKNYIVYHLCCFIIENVSIKVFPSTIYVHTKFIHFKYSTNTNENTFLWNNCTKYSTIFSIQMIFLFKIRINKLHEKSHSSIDHWYCLCCELNPYAKLDSVVKLW